MNREHAERLLAALIFDDLDEPSKTELQVYLETDDELRERLADMRMAVKLAGDAVNEGPSPVLSDERMEKLKKLAEGDMVKSRILTLRSILAIAATVVVGLMLLAGIVTQNFGEVHRARTAFPRVVRELATTTAPDPLVATSKTMDGSMYLYEAEPKRRVDGAIEMGVPYDMDVDGESTRKMTGMGSGPVANGSVVSDARRGVWSFSEGDVKVPEVVDGYAATVDGASSVRTITELSSREKADRQWAVNGTDVGQSVVSYEWSGPVAAAKPSSVVLDAAPTDSGQVVAGQAGLSATTPSIAAIADEERGHARLEDRKKAADPDGSDLASSSRFALVPVNPWVMTGRDSLSTFALDVDTASYALCRRYIRGGFLPPVGAVRMEEFINAFDYAYPQRDEVAFSVYAEGMPSPLAPVGQDLTLLKIAVKARTVGRDQRRAAHIVFVVDASASMNQPDRLPQVQAAMSLLVDKLSDANRVSLVTCSNEASLHLEAVSAKEKDRIRRTLDAIQPAGPTNLLQGLRIGYAMARRGFVAGQINQVVLCSDGVANVGTTEAQDVLNAVADDRKQGITLTCVGVGYGAYNDAFLEALADRGDGRYVFLDSSEQARMDLVGQLAATLQTVARDVRIQVQFDPARVRRYRLIGYENRDMEDRRFRDDTVDAGEVGSGQCSTALYELELIPPTAGEESGNLGAVSVRYRNAESGEFEEFARALNGSIVRRQTIHENPRFFLAAGVARFAEWLRQSEHAKDMRLSDVQDILDRVSAALPLDQMVQDVALLAHQAENLPRATETTVQP
ncbi:MAG: YfbK domain-containing protein [Solirubrobacterales bacterium]